MKSIRIVSLLMVILISLAEIVTVGANPGSITVASHAGVDMYGPIDHYAPLNAADWGTAKPALAFTDNAWPIIPGADWITSHQWTWDDDWDWIVWHWFHDELFLPCTAYNIDPDAYLTASADNEEEFYFNGTLVGTDDTWETFIDYPISPVPGANTLDFIIYNGGGPSGLTYKTTVNYETPEVIWMPPVNRQNYVFNNRGMLQLKFQLIQQDGSVIKDKRKIYVLLYLINPDGERGPSIYGWFFSKENLQFFNKNAQYLAQAKGKDLNLLPGTYNAEVYDLCTDDELGSIAFSVRSGSKKP